MNEKSIIKEIVLNQMELESSIAGDQIVDKLIEMDKPHEVNIKIPKGGDNLGLEEIIQVLSSAIAVIKITLETYLLFRDNFTDDQIAIKSQNAINDAHIDSTSIDPIQIIIEIKNKIG